MRRVERQVHNGEITYGKMLELIQDEVISNYTKQQDDNQNNELAQQIGKLNDEEFENNCVRLSKMFKQK